jgi:predicted DNA-binding transcriptional regulator YafY
MDEAVLLLVGLKLLDEMVEAIEFNGKSQEQLMEGLMDKLSGAIPSDLVAMTDEIVDDIVMATVDPFQAITADSSHPLPMYSIDGILPVLEQAVAESRSVTIVYFSMTREEFTTRRVDPYGLKLDGDLVWMAAYCHLREDMRVFRADRIKEVTLMDETFARPPAFSMDEYFDLDDDEEEG